MTKIDLKGADKVAIGIEPYTVPQTDGPTIGDYKVWWIDHAVNYINDAKVDPKVGHPSIPHKFPEGLPEDVTMHYEVGYNGQPVIVIGDTAYGLEIPE